MPTANEIMRDTVWALLVDLAQAKSRIAELEAMLPVKPIEQVVEINQRARNL